MHISSSSPRPSQTHILLHNTTQNELSNNLTFKMGRLPSFIYSPLITLILCLSLCMNKCAQMFSMVSLSCRFCIITKTHSWSLHTFYCTTKYTKAPLELQQQQHHTRRGNDVEKNVSQCWWKSPQGYFHVLYHRRTWERERRRERKRYKTRDVHAFKINDFVGHFYVVPEWMHVGHLSGTKVESL